MRPDRLVLAEIVDAAEQIVALTAGKSVGDIESDRTVRDALLWNFTVLGEAVANVSDETKAAAPEVEWREPGRIRNRIVHGYWSADLEVLLATARTDIPRFLAAVTNVAQRIEQDEQPS
jgi:uncharacterized protein with HEPN domain